MTAKTAMTSDRAGIELVFREDDAYRAEISNLRDDFAEAAALLCAREGIDPAICEVSITFETEEGIRELNAKYRGKDAATDVLSFPMYENTDELLEDAENAIEGEVLSLGDVVICPAVAKRQATEYGHSERRECVYLFVHSLLHLLGYDHEDDTDRAEMRAAEEDIMQQIGLGRERSEL
jgi:probable rRNA maturation factor